MSSPLPTDALTITLAEENITIQRRVGDTLLQSVTATGDRRGPLLDALLERVNVQLGRTGTGTTPTTTQLQVLDLFPSGGLWHVDPGRHTTTGLWVVRPWTRTLELLGPTTGADGAYIRNRVTSCAVPILMGARWRDSAIQHTVIMVAAHVPQSSGAEARMVPWPCGNVYDSGRVCWGELAPNLARIAPSPAAFRQLEDAFFYSTFNRDLLRGGWGTDPADATILRITTEQGASITPTALITQIVRYNQS